MRQRRILFVDDEETIRITMSAIFARHGFQVVDCGTVAEALHKITSEKFDVLLSDLNIGNPGDGLTVVSAMRRTQPEAVTMILTGFPAFQTALEAIRQQVDDYIVKPANIPELVTTIESKLAVPPRLRQLPPPKRVAMVLQEQTERIQELWLSALKHARVPSLDAAGIERRLQYFQAILEDIVRAAQVYSGGDLTPSHGFSAPPLFQRGFTEHTPDAVLTEFCLLRRILAQVVQENLLAINLSYVIPDLARVNETLDELAQAALKTLSGK